MKVLYFAWVRQKVGKSEEDVDMPRDVVSVAALARYLAARGDGYAEALSDTSRLRVAVNQEHVGFQTAIGPDDEVAFFPPVTGG